MFVAPTEASAELAQQIVAEEFAFFGDWSERYQYLIDLGRKLPPFDESDKRDEHLLAGCQSRVWVICRATPDQIDIAAISDSAIVSGLIALVLRVYSGRSPAEILGTAPRFIEDIGLKKHLSVTRSNGLHALIQRIRDEAAQASVR
ncbi:Fe-S cluster assembly protein SufE [Ahniella affigens]|uniref:Fe-S cluster assembly protein SufE n=2 Tax=Ahniella affigens TaxID=2021234 RepID=A0A2P1PZ20_9GAMM|nr:SufE family protein [Ahniella affigens]AVQ00103.1 Fe-S cluster assembly protein SufE [Ahniella affigens]